MRSHWAAAGGVRVHAGIAGDGPPVVLVHGFGVSGAYMTPLARALASTYRVYAPDLPGHGRSGRLRVAPGIGNLADALSRWLDAIGLRRAVFVANSMGC